MRLARSRVIEAALGIAIAAECIANAASRGIIASPDTKWFAAAGNDLLTHHFNIFHLYRAMPTSPRAS